MRRKRSKVTILKDKADGLFQRKYIEEKPLSIVSGQPTEVIHHFIEKKKSNNLRYDKDNAIPLTNKEHCQHHFSGDPMIVITIKEKMGQEWLDDIQARRRIDRKFNIGYLNTIIEQLTI